MCAVVAKPFAYLEEGGAQAWEGVREWAGLDDVGRFGWATGIVVK